jgi:hypothetical protein
VKDKDIESGARAIAEDFKLPGGRRKAVAKLVRHHLSWFDAAKDRGMGVDDILTLLTHAGATYEDGSSINFDTLSNALWRKRNGKSVEPAQKDTVQRRRNKGVSGRSVQPKDGRKPSAKHRLRRPATPMYDYGKEKPRAGLVTGGVHDKNAKASRAEILGFMRRAAAIRRSKGDDD